MGTLNKIAVNSDAQQVAVNCGEGSCTGMVSHEEFEQYRGLTCGLARIVGLVGIGSLRRDSRRNREFQWNSGIQPVVDIRLDSNRLIYFEKDVTSQILTR